MKRGVLMALVLAASSLAHAAGDQVALGCKRLHLVLDAQFTSSELARLWGTGDEVSGAPAVLELLGCQGEVLDRLTLEAPLAKLDRRTVRGPRMPTVLVTVDLTAAAGSYNGPLTKPIEVVDNRLQAATALTADGRSAPVVLTQTGKANWKRVTTQGRDHFLAVQSEPSEGQFTTRYRHYSPSTKGWQVRERVQPGLWESDGEFPPRRSFP